MRSFGRRHGRRVVGLALIGVATATGVAVSRAQQPAPTPYSVIIDSGRGQRFAVPECVPRRGDEATREACKTISSVVRSDLQFEGLFQFVPENLINAIPAQNPDAPNFVDWKSINAEILVVTRADVNGDQITLELKVYFVSAGKVMLARQFSGPLDNPRAIAHQASDEIMAQTQYRGVSRTKIAFVSDRDAAKGKATKELYLVDYDGFNLKRLTANGSLNILPAWRPDGKGLAYVSYRQGPPNIFLALIYEGRGQTLTSSGAGGRSSQAFAPSFSPDGTHIAYASNRSGNMEIWVANADGSDARRLTNSPALDTAPCWSSTGQEIAFTSDRSGAPQIWSVDSEGLNLRRVSRVGNYNDAAAWSPSKEFSEIAYTSRLEGSFEVAVVSLSTGVTRQITPGQGSCESPSWAPSGRHLVYSCRRGGRWQIMVSDREGRNAHSVASGNSNNLQPDWGPWPAR
jgi:TolB protein